MLSLLLFNSDGGAMHHVPCITKIIKSKIDPLHQIQRNLFPSSPISQQSNLKLGQPASQLAAALLGLTRLFQKPRKPITVLLKTGYY
jgi:hypothetical protein